MHFHGLFHHSSNQFDGVPGVTQCEILPNQTLTYNFTVPDQIGLFWYHSHTSGQYMDGFRGLFLVDDPDAKPFDYDEEVVLDVSDWYHEMVQVLTGQFLNKNNPTGAEPIPQTLLFNDTRNGTWHVRPDTTYYVRLVNIGGFVSQYLWMEDHDFTIVAVDGVYVEPNTTDILYISVGQRYDVLIHTKNETDRNYAFMQKMDEDMLDTDTGLEYLNVTNTISYSEDNPPVHELYNDVLYTDYFDDFYLVPLNHTELYEDYDYRVEAAVVMTNLNDGVNYAFFNNMTWTEPKVPSLATLFSAPDDLVTNEAIYGSNTLTHILHQDEIVELVINNNDTGKHPMHLHGHVFQLIERGPDFADEPEPVNWNESAPYEAPEYPVLRDTVTLPPQSWIRIRFKANNPGIWFFHCQLNWHLMQGLAMTFIEQGENIKSRQDNFTRNWRDVCQAAGTPIEGNAAGNTEDWLDLRGENRQVKYLPSGFTAKGIVALVFSTIAGILGCAAICVYGMADIPNIEQKVFEDLSPEERVDLANEADEEEDLEGSSGTRSKSSDGGYQKLSHELNEPSRK